MIRVPVKMPPTDPLPLPLPLPYHQLQIISQKQLSFLCHPHHLWQLTLVLPPSLEMKTPKLDGAQEYGFRLGKLGNLSQIPSHSLPTLEFHLTLHSLPTTTLPVGYFSWFGRPLHPSRTSLVSHGCIKASGPMFQILPLISHQHTIWLPLLHPHQHVLLRISYPLTQTSAHSYLTTSFGLLLERSLEQIETTLPN